MNETDYPALFRNADKAATNRQVTYFRILIAQYVFLLLASLTSVSNLWVNHKAASAIYLVCVSLAAFMLLYGALKKPEMEWYGARALAESIKTLTWRFSMAAEPFDESRTADEVAKEFSSLISELLIPHKINATALSYAISDGHGSQITPKMEASRLSPFEVRRDLYKTKRIEDQLRWYRKKSLENKRKADWLSILCAFVYLIAIFVAVAQFGEINLGGNWLSEPILVLAAGLLGWIQAKRHSELATSYNLTSHEVSKIFDNVSRIHNNSNFSEFVNEAEAAFSREHTQWVARQLSSST